MQGWLSFTADELLGIIIVRRQPVVNINGVDRRRKLSVNNRAR